MPEILERPADSGVAPRRVLFRHAHDESRDVGEHARTTALPPRVRPLARDQLPMPPQNRVGRDKRGDLSQPATTQQVPAHGQPTPIIIAQPEASSPQLTSKDAILFDQIRQGLLLPLIQPADQRDKKQPQRENVDHGGRVYLTDRDSISRGRWAEL